jgi:sugar/nucleoside kinase (ribokinase family)
MRTRDQQTDAATTIHDPAGGGDTSLAGLAAARTAAGNLAAAGRDAIRRALSESSTEFLRASRQQGGE